MSFLKIAALLCFAASVLSADTLRLRDGTILVGNYAGGTQTEIWFQRSPAGAEPFPLFAVESLRFGPLLGSSAPPPSVLKTVGVNVARKLPREFGHSSEQGPPTLATLLRLDRFAGFRTTSALR